MTRVTTSTGIGSDRRAKAGPKGIKSSAGPVCIGFDVGSVACKAAALDNSGNVLGHWYRRTNGRPVKVALEVLQEVLAKYASNGIASISGTGSAGRFICELTDIPFVNELLCQALYFVAGAGRDGVVEITSCNSLGPASEIFDRLQNPANGEEDQDAGRTASHR